MTNEEKQIMGDLQREVEKCFDLAQRMDAFNPELVGSFTGTPSERIERQIRAFKAFGSLMSNAKIPGGREAALCASPC